MRKVLYGLTLIIALVMCLTLLFFPVLKFDRDSIYENHQDEIDAFVLDELANGSSKTKEELEEEAVNNIIYQTLMVLQMYYSSNDVVYDEDNNVIESTNDYEAIMLDVYRIKEKGIRYTDLANSIKNQIDYDVKINNAIKEATGKGDIKLFFEHWQNPIPMIVIFLLVALIFASAVLVIVRSVRGIFERKRNKLLAISIFGTLISLALFLMPIIFTKNIDLTAIDNLNQFVRVFIMNIKVTSVCIYCGIGFLVCTLLTIFARFFSYSK